jgi:type IV secretory pathway VirB2 component (pilin)
MMSEGLLFTFGAVIFFIVFGGATLFGMASLRKFEKNQES